MALPALQVGRSPAQTRSATLGSGTIPAAAPVGREPVGRAHKNQRRPHRRAHQARRLKMTRYAKLTAGLLGAWFVFSLSASALHLFVGKPDQPPIALLLAFVGPLAIFLTWYRSSDSFRSYVLGLNPKTLTLLHPFR